MILRNKKKNFTRHLGHQFLWKRNMVLGFKRRMDMMNDKVASSKGKGYYRSKASNSRIRSGYELLSLKLT